MKKTLLCLAVLGAMGAAQVAMAQDFDDRWYVDGSVGYNFQDGHRGDNNAPFGTIGFGKNLDNTWAFELNFNYQNPKEVDPDLGGHWEQYGLSFDTLYHFHIEGANWNPYMRFGVGYEHEKEDFFTPLGLGGPEFQRKHDSLTADLGLGLERKWGRYAFRTEFGERFDGDNDSVNSPGSHHFIDEMASVGLAIALGPEPVKAVEPAPPPPAPVATCADKDSDGDGVNDCNDKCPNTPPGTTVGPDGCPVPVTIDLRGVNFDFDKSKLRPDAVEILNQAIDVLKKYPAMKVEVAGHTDLCGTDAYNQKLSERRAKAVYDYLAANGVDAGRLTGPDGYGDTRPLEQTPKTLPACKSEKNRRTELNVQN